MSDDAYALRKFVADQLRINGFAYSGDSERGVILNAIQEWVSRYTDARIAEAMSKMAARDTIPVPMSESGSVVVPKGGRVPPGECHPHCGHTASGQQFHVLGCKAHMAYIPGQCERCHMLGCVCYLTAPHPDGFPGSDDESHYTSKGALPLDGNNGEGGP